MYFFTQMKKYVNLKNLQKKYRKLNGHNFTVLHSDVPLNKITVGKGTYGNLNIRSYKLTNEKLVIKNYVSIADNVTFLLGGCHYLNRFSTYNFNQKYGNKLPEAFSKGTITIEDDVYIGHGSMILSGVTIGRGAVIGAGSVVARDIPPYAIAVGNPCKVKKYRFDDTIITELNKINFAELSLKHVMENYSTVSKTIENQKQVNEIINKLQK